MKINFMCFWRCWFTTLARDPRHAWNLFGAADTTFSESFFFCFWLFWSTILNVRHFIAGQSNILAYTGDSGVLCVLQLLLSNGPKF